MPPAGINPRTDFLAGAGEMGVRIRDFDWASTPLGPVESWPSSLKTAVGLMLRSRHPMWIGWGPEMLCLYNDAYQHVLGPAKHPSALGQPAAQVWSEIWDVCGPLADKVFGRGEATFVDDVRLFMDRGSFVEETFYSFSYSPIVDENGNVAGLFCPSADVTPKVLNARRLATLSQLSADALIQKTTADACATAARMLAGNPDDIPFALLYLADGGAQHGLLAQAAGTFTSDTVRPRIADLRAGSPPQPWPLADVFHNCRSQTVSVTEFRGLPYGLDAQPIREAVVLPVTTRGAQQPYGVLVVGVSPARQLDTDYHTFFELVAGQVAMAIQNARAVEEEKKRADMLAEIDRAKTVFFSNVSHEFRTPLTLMLGPLENLLAGKDHLRPEDQEQIVVAHRNSLRLLKLVNSLLDFSRIEAGRMQANYVASDLATLTADLAATFRSAMESAGLQFVVDCEALDRPVSVDREMWEKIVLNLLSNAFKFTLTGSVNVRLRAHDNDAVLTVTDTGTGIAASELPRIFERFHRVEGARGRTYEGTGIGLALVQELVKLHAGSITAESEPGKGTTFTVTIPMGAVPPEAHSTSPVPEAASAAAFTKEAETWFGGSSGRRAARKADQGTTQQAKKGRVLLADDNADMREYICHILGQEYEVFTAKDGQEALDMLRETPPDLLLSDIMMPRLDGLGLLRQVRSNPVLQTLPVIFISARAGEDMRVEGLKAGADDYLVKPFTADELKARVDTHVRMTITRRRAMEREATLRAEAEAARDEVVQILESMTDGFVAIDEGWRITYVNAECEKLTGMTCEQMVGQNYWDLFPAAVGTTLYHELTRCAQERVPVEFENDYAPWSRWFYVKAYPSPGGGISLFYQDISTRRHAEEELRRSEERFRGVFNSSAIGVAVLTLETRFTQANKAFSTITGYSEEELKTLECASLTHPADRGAMQEQLDRLTSGETETFVLDKRYIRKDGRIIWVQDSVSLLRDAAGRPECIIALSEDITGRKHAEEAAQLLAAIVNSSDDAILSKDLNGIVTTWNKGAERLFGYSAEEITGQPITLLIPEDRRHEEPAILARLQQGEPLNHFETVRRRRDGTLVDVSLTISPVRNRQGKVVGASKIARDITDRKQAEQALRESERRFRQLVEVGPQFVWVTRADGETEYINRRWLEYSGLDLADMADPERMAAGIHPDDLPVMTERWADCLRTGTPFETEARLRRKDGAFRWFMVRTVPVPAEDGRIEKWLGASTDIHDQKQVEEELRRANNDLEQFAYSASHDLQEPLRTVKIYSELLTRRYRDKLDGQALEYCDYLSRGASRMELLVRDLLAYTHVTKLELPKEETDANEALADVLNDLAGAIAESGANVTADPLPHVQVHSTHLKQLFQNLIGNAIKYRSADRVPHIRVSADRQDGHWVFAVRDNGIGIDPEYKERVFGLFRRLHTNREYSGTGIGLAICQRIVERYHGRIWVESQPGQGSTFLFRLPA